MSKIGTKLTATISAGKQLLKNKRINEIVGGYEGIHTVVNPTIGKAKPTKPFIVVSRSNATVAENAKLTDNPLFCIMHIDIFSFDYMTSLGLVGEVYKCFSSPAYLKDFHLSEDFGEADTLNIELTSLTEDWDESLGMFVQSMDFSLF